VNTKTPWRYSYSLKKLNYIEETATTVIYRSKMTCGKNKKNFVVYKAEDFIAAICQHNSSDFSINLPYANLAFKRNFLSAQLSISYQTLSQRL